MSNGRPWTEDENTDVFRLTTVEELPYTVIGRMKRRRPELVSRKMRAKGVHRHPEASARNEARSREFESFRR